MDGSEISLGDFKSSDCASAEYSEAQAATEAYAQRLGAKIPQDAMVKKYYEAKIAEARTIVR